MMSTYRLLEGPKAILTSPTPTPPHPPSPPQTKNIVRGLRLRLCVNKQHNAQTNRFKQLFDFSIWFLVRQCKISGKNGLFRNIENLQHKKIADLVLLSLFMRTNGKCNNSHAPSTDFSGILLSVRTQYSRRTKI